jgi:uncharacterized protein (DUF2249 family)
MVLIDARQMEPPEPFERVMEALGTLAPGDSIRMLIYREPTPLYRVLRENGYRHRTELSAEEGCFVIDITAAP